VRGNSARRCRQCGRWYVVNHRCLEQPDLRTAVLHRWYRWGIWQNPHDGELEYLNGR
jgi:hypothetical protein